MREKSLILFLSGVWVVVSCQFSLAAVPKTGWDELAGWSTDNHAQALQAFVRGCDKIQHKPLWQSTCHHASKISAIDDDKIARQFFEDNFAPHCLKDKDSAQGLITGYYEPLLQGSRKLSATYRHPIYKVPDDLLHINSPQSNHVRGRLKGKDIVPYWTREAIHSSHQPLLGNELLWVNDPIALFFLHVQGSGLVKLEDGTIIGVNYADDNGHAYQSIGRQMVVQNIMPVEDVNLFSIRQWLINHPDKYQSMLNTNPRYIFFRESAVSKTGPIGALGVELTPERSIAVDKSIIELGSPVWLNSSMPDNPQQPLQRLMIAQDTGSAIRGKIRADVFWGRGHRAEKMAGLMKNKGELCVLLPIDR